MINNTSPNWLPDSVIFMTLHGSHAYGLNIPESDIDMRGVCVPPAEYFFSASQTFDQYVQREPDLTVFGLRKFASLASQCNPNVVEILFTEPRHHQRVTALGEQLIGIRNLFVTKRARHTFSGYAASQLGRIRRHYQWLKNPPKARPERKDFGLPDRTLIPQDQLKAADAAISKQLDEWSVKFLDDVPDAARMAVTQKMTAHLAEIGVAMDENAWVGAARVVGLTDNMVEQLDRERRYNGAMKTWGAYQEWLSNRNEKRAALEARFGYDTKHAMHLVRLLRMAREILTTGEVHVFRRDADELMAIRRGEWSYDRLVEWAEAEDAALQGISLASALPNKPDIKRIDAEIVRIHRAALHI
jgi:predicted nucleotidyltransferase